MKQRITTEQLNELDDKQKEKLKKWFKPKWGDLVKVNFEKKISEEPSTLINLDDHINDGIVVNPEEIKDELPLLSIGQMIEFLDDGSLEFKDRDAKVIVWEWNKELCDELWERVKEKLK